MNDRKELENPFAKINHARRRAEEIIQFRLMETHGHLEKTPAFRQILSRAIQEGY